MFLMILFGLFITPLNFLWRLSYWVRNICKCNNANVPESEWKDSFQMSEKSFYELWDKFRPNLEKKRTRLRTPISVEMQVGSFLYYISDVIEKPQTFLEYLEHPFLELLKEYPMLS